MDFQNSLHRPAVPEDEPEKIFTQSTRVALCLNIVHVLTQFCLGGAVITALFVPVTIGIFPLFAPQMQHIILCTIGYFVLMAQAILVFSPFGFARNLKYENKKMIHAGMQIVGSALAIAGGAVRISAGTWRRSWDSHGIVGIIAFALTVASFIGGVVNYITSRGEKKRSAIIIHSSLGTLTIIFAYLSLIFAFGIHYIYLIDEPQSYFGIALACISLVGTIITASVTNIKRILNR